MIGGTLITSLGIISTFTNHRLTLKDSAYFSRSIHIIKDRLGKSGCDLLWVYLNLNIHLNLKGIRHKICKKNSPYSYLFVDIGYSF